MNLKLYGIATAIALAFAGNALAQSSNTSSDRKLRNAEEDKVEADYKAAKAKCETMKGNQKDVCEKEAKANEKVAKAELNAKKNPSERNQRKVQETKIDAKYDVAKEKCDAMKGNEKDACEKTAKAERDRAKADMKRAEAKTERKQAGTGATRNDKPAK